jgi:hypothetical protein
MSATVPVTSPRSSLSEESISDELQCDHCSFKGVSSVGLKIHIGRKHDKIPQVDGEGSTSRETDCYWERNRKDRLKTFQVFMDVLMDIEESSISEAEKISEKEYVTSVRKEALGSNYIYCPPWSVPNTKLN